jgi:hypothetical protein
MQGQKQGVLLVSRYYLSGELHGFYGLVNALVQKLRVIVRGNLCWQHQGRGSLGTAFCLLGTTCGCVVCLLLLALILILA